MNDHVTDVRDGSRGIMTFYKSASFFYIQLQHAVFEHPFLGK